MACHIAKKISELPYRYSKIKRKSEQYTSQNTVYGDQLNIQFSLRDVIRTPSDLDIWLTERYALFQDTDTTINEYEIHHPAWSLQEIELKELKIDYPRFHTLLKGKPDTTAYSTGVQVVAWGMHKKNKTDYALL